jgi:hypothetical protein
VVVTCNVGARPIRLVSCERYAARVPASIRAPAGGAGHRPVAEGGEAARLFPDATNAVFHAFRYAPDEVPWLRD